MLGESDPSRRSNARAPVRQSGESCCSDAADRIASIVASIKGRAKSGLQASSLFSKLTLRLYLGRERVLVVVEELVDVEVVSSAVVVESHMIVVKIEVVGHSEDPALSEKMIWLSGVRSAEIACEVVLMKRIMAKSCEMVDDVAGAELAQGRCSCD